MTTIILVVHLLIAVALIGVVLLQRSEGGALGIGSGGAGSLFSSRGVANVLTRTTAILAVAFFVTSIALTMIAKGACAGIGLRPGETRAKRTARAAWRRFGRLAAAPAGQPNAPGSGRTMTGRAPRGLSLALSMPQPSSGRCQMHVFESPPDRVF